MGFNWDKDTGLMTLTRGDSARVRCTLRTDKVVYEMQDGDKIMFGVKADYDDAECLFEREYTENPFVLSIDPADTKSLDFGVYVYDMQFVAANGFTRTFYEKKRLKLTEEVV